MQSKSKAIKEKGEILGPLIQMKSEELQLLNRHREVHLSIGIKLRQKREASRITLREMARRMRFSAPYVSDVELGRRDVTVKFADAYLEALHQ